MTTPTYNLDWLQAKVDNGDTLKFLFFWGHTAKAGEAVGKFCFSQWFESPFTVDGITYPTTEHWMMAQKALLFGDQINFEKIIKAQKPGAAKALGRKVTGFDESTWQAHRFEIVIRGNLHKFTQNREMGRYLLETDNRILVEASPVDRIWGIGLSKDHRDAGNVYAWKGLNLLGFALMEVRDQLV